MLQLPRRSFSAAVVCAESRFAQALAVEDYALPREEVDRLVSPALCVHLDKVRSNIATVLALCGGDPQRWRPHVKTTKMPAVWRELAAAGVTRFKCATPREADVLARTLTETSEEDRGWDVLLAMSVTGPNLARFVEVAAAHPRVAFSVLVEDPSGVEAVASALAAAPSAVALGAFLDLDCGMRRTGMALDAAEAGGAERVADRCASLGVELRGLHMYDGHSASLPAGDGSRRRAMWREYDRLLALARAVEAARSCRLGELVTSGTPSLTASLAHPGLAASGRHRTSAGTVVLHDLNGERSNPDLELTPAAVVMARVVSRPAPGLATLDAGNKALAADMGDPCAFVVGRPRLAPMTPSEEHLPLDATAEEAAEGDGAGARPALERGDEVYLVPRHVCPSVNLAESALIVDGGRIVGIEEVAARSHELVFVG
jgi:D-serine deaminase-like pyridoxal phosphate-dependent protein